MCLTSKLLYVSLKDSSPKKSANNSIKYSSAVSGDRERYLYCTHLFYKDFTSIKWCKCHLSKELK